MTTKIPSYLWLLRGLLGIHEKVKETTR